MLYKPAMESKTLIPAKIVAETLADPKCGTYYDPTTDEYICVAKADGKYIRIGSYSKASTLKNGGAEFKKMAEKEIWSNFLWQQ